MGDVSKGILIGLGVLGANVVTGEVIRSYASEGSALEKVGEYQQNHLEDVLITGLLAGGAAYWLLGGSRVGAGLALSVPVAATVLVGSILAIAAATNQSPI